MQGTRCSGSNIITRCGDSSRCSACRVAPRTQSVLLCRGVGTATQLTTNVGAQMVMPVVPMEIHIAGLDTVSRCLVWILSAGSFLCAISMRLLNEGHLPCSKYVQLLHSTVCVPFLVIVRLVSLTFLQACSEAADCYSESCNTCEPSPGSNVCVITGQAEGASCSEGEVQGTCHFQAFGYLQGVCKVGTKRATTEQYWTRPARGKKWETPAHLLCLTKLLSGCGI